MIRMILTGIFLVVFFIASLIMFVFLAIVGKFNSNLKDRMSFAIVTWALGVVKLLSGAKITVKGLENIPDDTAVLYVSNHRSFFDIIIGYTLVKPLCGFVSKIEIKKVPILSSWMKRMHCLFLDRSDIKAGMKMVLDGVDNLKNGISVFICPEGTRGKTDDSLKEFKEGSLKMAEKAKVPVIPVAFNNTSALFEDHFPFIKKARVVVEFGKPIYPDKLDKEQKKHLGAIAHDEIKAMLENNKKFIA